MAKNFPEPTRPFLFQKGQKVTHAKTRGDYIIMELPDEAVIEETWEAAYGYVPVSGGPKIYRSQAKMEDGRFIKYET